MTSPLPTEEDILAHLVLFGARPITTNSDATAQIEERLAWNAAVAFPADAPLNPVAILAHGRLMASGSIEAAIADSERRLEVERARDAVIGAVARWCTKPPTIADHALEDAWFDYLAALLLVQ